MSIYYIIFLLGWVVFGILWLTAKRLEKKYKAAYAQPIPDVQTAVQRFHDADKGFMRVYRLRMAACGALFLAGAAMFFNIMLELVA